MLRRNPSITAISSDDDEGNDNTVDYNNGYREINGRRRMAQAAPPLFAIGSNIYGQAYEFMRLKKEPAVMGGVAKVVGVSSVGVEGVRSIMGVSGAHLAWAFLLVAVVLELIGTLLLKVSTTAPTHIPFLTSLLSYNISLILFKQSLSHISISTAYTVWSGLGTAIITMCEVAFFGGELPWSKCFALGGVVLGCVVLEQGEE